MFFCDILLTAARLFPPGAYLPRGGLVSFRLIKSFVLLLYDIRLRFFFPSACNHRGQKVTREWKEWRETKGRQVIRGNQASPGGQDQWWVRFPWRHNVSSLWPEKSYWWLPLSGPQRRLQDGATRPPWSTRYPRFGLNRTDRSTWATGASRTPFITIKIWFRYNSSSRYCCKEAGSSLHLVRVADGIKHEELVEWKHFIIEPVGAKMKRCVR